MFPRWVYGLVIVFIVAALAAIASAWGFAMWSPGAGSGPEGLRLDDPLVRPHFQHEPRQAPFRRAMTMMREGRGWRVDNIMAFTEVYAGGPHNQTRRMLYRAGWPWYCVQGEEWVVRGQPGPSRGLLDPPAFLGANETSMRKLPWRPIWPAFLLTTGIIAFIPSMIVLFFPLRRVVRRRRGCCAMCGYDLNGLERERTSGRCPECGTAAPRVLLRR